MTRRPRGVVWAAWALLAAGAVLLAGCGHLGYYWQAASGHVALMHAAKPVEQWRADGRTAKPLEQKLATAQRIRRFASDELALPDNASYTRYADLGRPAAVWNVVAAPPYSLALKTWCFPVAGCVGYRGYYDLEAARAQAQGLRGTGLEAAVYPVPAYSTLGWLNWAGGDPLLSTFIGYPEGELARIIFHELAHQVLYVSGDMVFNESYATAVERLGGARWLDTQAGAGARAEYAAFDDRRRQMRQLMLQTRQALAQVYESPAAKAGDWAAVEAGKQAAMADFRARYADLRAQWTGPRQGAWDAWVAAANNATFGAQAAYDELVPAFEQLFAQQGHDWPAFHAEARRIAALPTPEARRQALLAEAAGSLSAPSAAPLPPHDPHDNNPKLKEETGVRDSL